MLCDVICCGDLLYVVIYVDIILYCTHILTVYSNLAKQCPAYRTKLKLINE